MEQYQFQNLNVIEKTYFN